MPANHPKHECNQKLGQNMLPNILTRLLGAAATEGIKWRITNIFKYCQGRGGQEMCKVF